MFNDHELMRLEKELRDLLLKERGFNNSLRLLQEERKRDMDRIEREFEHKETRMHAELEHVLRDIDHTEKELDRRKQDLQKEMDRERKK